MVERLRRKISKSEVLMTLKNIAFVLVGCLVLAFADAAFLTPSNIVSGGVVSVGIILNYYLEPATHFDWTDIIVTAVQVILFIIGWFTLGKKFSLNTLVASVAYPGFYALLYRPLFGGQNFGQLLGIEQALQAGRSDQGTAELILAGIFGGALAGAGVGIAYLGNGSTGGFDIVSFIIAKYSEMKEDVSGFIIDSSLILIGMICMRDVLLGLVGILAALACAVAVQYVYVNSDTFVIVDILSDHFEEIQDYIHKDMDHATTLIDTVGGYTGQKRKMIRVVIYQVETSELRTKIAEMDPKAFVSFTTAKTINGEGFEPFIIPRKPHAKPLHRAQHETQYEDQVPTRSKAPKTSSRALTVPEKKEKLPAKISAKKSGDKK
jgi:uncharacterized membrane-anchored protein YitT (DUF2179 family)